MRRIRIIREREKKRIIIIVRIRMKIRLRIRFKMVIKVIIILFHINNNIALSFYSYSFFISSLSFDSNDISVKEPDNILCGNFDLSENFRICLLHNLILCFTSDTKCFSLIFNRLIVRMHLD